MTQHEELILIKGQPPVKKIIRSTRHGPLLSDFTGDGSEEALALRWTAHEPSQEFRAVYGINRARNWSEFLASLADHGAPSLNYVYADRENNIGYTLAGKIPVRAANPALLPVNGWETACEWRGFIPFEALPRLYNPPQAMVATANNRIVDAPYPQPFAQLYEPSHRIRRIQQLLDADERLSMGDMAAIQSDTVSLHARELLQLLAADLNDAAAAQPKYSAAVRELLEWDGDCHEKSTPAGLFHVFHHRLITNLLVPTLGEELFRAYVEILNQCIAPLDAILADPASVWFSERSRREVVSLSLQEACEELRESCGADRDKWRWGRIHRLTLRHALGGNALLHHIANIGPLPSRGDGMTIDSGFYRHSNPFDHVIGPALRMIIDTGHWERSGFVLPAGQSGHPLSPHYRDQLDLWLRGRRLSLFLDDNAQFERCLNLAPC
jgi:penicillin amidase